MAELICIVCPKGCHLKVDVNDNFKVTGQACERGEEYGREELQNPVRVVTSTVRVTGSLINSRCPVKTLNPIPKRLITAAMEMLNDVELVAPVECGSIVISDICGTGIPFVTTRRIS